MTLWMLLMAILMRKYGAVGASAKAEVQMVESLRRQLMHDNYDYMEGSDSDAITTTLTPPHAFSEENSLDDYLDPSAASLLPPPPSPSPRARIDLPTEQIPVDTMFDRDLNAAQAPESDPRSMLPRSPSRRVLDGGRNKANYKRNDTKDLLSYVEDLKIDDPLLNEIDVTLAHETIPTTTPRFKILEERDISAAKSGRRSRGGAGRGGKGGRGPARRFLQEERDGHIAIVNLAGGPFPEFRLPKSRRQYMADDYDENENEILGNTMDEAPTTTLVADTSSRRAGPRRAPLPWSYKDFITPTTTRKKSHSEEYGLKMSSAYEQLMKEKQMQRDRYLRTRDPFGVNRASGRAAPDPVQLRI